MADLGAVAMGAAPAPDEEDAGEDVERDGAAEDGVREGREKPGGFIDVGVVAGGIDVKELIEREVFELVHFDGWIILHSGGGGGWRLYRVCR